MDGTYLPDQRIPSVRELGVEVEVNPNTVMRSYERLQQMDIIYNKRGVGYFISPTAKDEIHKQRHAAFIREELPTLFKEMDLLGISIELLNRAYAEYSSKKQSD
ncbi:GntR family transcriptional regulator [Massilibacteroides vaginae]|uniref:GntR family transcriptional regulator n=1 Tax=Massilibacteroides vaginae TaxID=1673718 RepID=UPI001FE78949|nr:GntR family transcriptional regulator [Massilibacteroides vaginae]